MSSLHKKSELSQKKQCHCLISRFVFKYLAFWRAAFTQIKKNNALNMHGAGFCFMLE